MSTEEKLASPVAALTSLVLHALLLLAPIGLSARATKAPEPALPAVDNWAARSVEVGTVPDVREPEPRTAPDAREPEPGTPSAPPAPAAPREAVVEQAEPHVPRVPAPRAQPPASASVARPTQPPVVASAAPAPVASAPSAPGAPESGGSLGAVGLPPGVRHLATAFTRALPAGGYKDAAWSELPLGPVGDLTVSLEVTESGELGAVEVEPAQGLAPALQRMIQRVVLLLKTGTFSLDPRVVRGGGSERLAIRVTLSHRSANPDELAAPNDLFAQSFVAPKPGEPGHARFTLNSGRHVEAVVRYATETPR